MKIYRCVLGILLAFFIIAGVWYIVSNYSERRSTDEGTLVFIEIPMKIEGLQ